MRKILLIGRLNEVMRSLNECLVEDFFVQICSEEIENVKAMVRIVKPEMAIVCQVGIEKVDRELLDWFRNNQANLPVLIIGTRQDWMKYRDFCENEQFDKLFRPVEKRDILAKCYNMLNIQNSIYHDVYYEKEPKKILVIDDSAFLLRNIKSLLGEKYTVFLATSGEQGLAMIPNKQPDLILLDYEMPGLDGKKTFDILQTDEFAKHIPVIFLTGNAGRTEVYKVLKSMPNGYILKPPNKDDLLDRIEAVLEEN